jgi:hypothetical protein
VKLPIHFSRKFQYTVHNIENYDTYEVYEEDNTT